ncbi:MAG: oligosaccharide repeat unit polymerase [Fibrobacter sp.]|nr:oligosaccharide repeat unit polymerase [Fibrobacter sp.]
MFSLISEYPETTVLSLIVVGLLFYIWKAKKDFFSPASVYIFFQCLTLAIAYLQMDRAMTPFHLKTWGVWIGALVSFTSACLLYQWGIAEKKLPEHVPVQNDFLYNWKWHFVLSCGILAIYLVGIFGIIKVVGSLILFSGDPSHWTSPLINYGIYAQFFSSAPLVVMLFGVAMFKSVNPVRWIRVVSRIVAPAIAVLSICAYPSRTTLFMSVGFLVILFNYLRKRIPVLLIAAFLVLGISAFVFVASARSQYLGNNSIKSMTMDAAMTMPYRYVANNYWNLDYVLNPDPDRHIHSFTYGIDFFAGILEYSGAPGAIRTSMGWDGLFNESVQKVPGYNTTGYLWEVYKDFGLPGCFVFPFFAGLALSVLYARMNRERTLRRVMLYVFFIYFVGFWFFLAGYKQGLFWIWGVLIYAISTICAADRKRIA